MADQLSWIEKLLEEAKTFDATLFSPVASPDKDDKFIGDCPEVMADTKQATPEQCPKCGGPKDVRWCINQDGLSVQHSLYRAECVPCDSDWHSIEQSAEYWKSRAATAELKVLTFQQDAPTINRFELIDHTKDGRHGCGRVKVIWEDADKIDIGFQLQDGGRTLKVFVREAKAAREGQA